MLTFNFASAIIQEVSLFGIGYGKNCDVIKQ